MIFKKQYFLTRFIFKMKDNNAKMCNKHDEKYAMKAQFIYFFIL